MAAFGEEDGPEDDEEMRFLAAAIEEARLEQSKIDKEYEIQKAAIEEETRIQEEIEKKQISDMTAEEIRVNKIMMEVSIRRLEMKIAKDKELEKEREVARANHVFEDSIAAEQARLKEEKKKNALLLKNMLSAKGNSKAIASQYSYRIDPADDPTRRAIVHHTGSHYVNAHSKAFKVGDKVKGLVARHSRQAAIRLQKSKNKMLAARDAARGQTGPSDNASKTASKKSKATGGARPRGQKA
jgi:hypothetical protein